MSLPPSSDHNQSCPVSISNYQLLMVAQLDKSLYIYPVVSVHKYEITFLYFIHSSLNMYIRSTPVTLTFLYMSMCTCFIIAGMGNNKITFLCGITLFIKGQHQ